MAVTGIEIGICFSEDVHSILNRLSDVNKAEYEKLGWPLDRVRVEVLAFMALADTRVLRFNGKAQAVLAIKKTDIGRTTWFVASQEFFDNFTPSVLRVGRQYMANAARRYGPLLSLSNSDHPHATKWFEACGFTLAETVGDMKIFLYTPRRS